MFHANSFNSNPQLLKSETIEQMFQPHLPEGGKFLSQQLQDPLMRQGLAGNFDEGTKLNWGLGGMINESPLASTGRKGGSMQWGGMPNLIWVSLTFSLRTSLRSGGILFLRFSLWDG